MNTSVRNFKIPMKGILVPLLSSMVLVVVVFVFFDALGRHAAVLKVLCWKMTCVEDQVLSIYQSQIDFSGWY
ncbi:MAG: hypothetical protein ACI9UJ_002537 [bacterium]|jgi:hypothetical protein